MWMDSKKTTPSSALDENDDDAVGRWREKEKERGNFLTILFICHPKTLLLSPSIVILLYQSSTL